MPHHESVAPVDMPPPALFGDGSKGL